MKSCGHKTTGRWLQSGYTGGRGNKILWTKDSLQADMNILIWKFTNKHQETDPYLLQAGIIGEDPSCSSQEPNRARSGADEGAVSMYHSLRWVLTGQQTEHATPGVF